MDFGAVTHHSKQYLIENGLYKKQFSKIQIKNFIETGGTKLNHKKELPTERTEEPEKGEKDEQVQ